MADPEEVSRTYRVDLTPLNQFNDLAVLILAVPHQEYGDILNGRVSEMVGTNGIVVDVKSALNPSSLRSDIRYWSL